MIDNPLTERARQVRGHILRMMARSSSSHIGSCFSIVEILAVLYGSVLRLDRERPGAPGRDRFLLSKGHASAALYATLAEFDLLPMAALERYYCDDGLLPGHLDKECSPWIEAAAGSLGHGLSLGLGMALAQRRRGDAGNVYVLLGDGECNEGSVWEAVMLASHLRLANLTAIVDCNHIQSFGRVSEVLDQAPLGARWESFGWQVAAVDGHDCDALQGAFACAQNRPKVLLADTVKGKGISFMEDRLEWHYRSPNPDQLLAALGELGLAE